MNPDVTVRDARRHGEVHLLRAAHRARSASTTRIEGRDHRRTASSRPPASRAARRGAIVFGSLNDPSSRCRSCTPIRAATTCCTRLGTRPRTAYLARVRNPNPELA